MFFMEAVYTKQRVPVRVIQDASRIKTLMDIDMLKRSTGCRLLLVTPVLFILLQVALSLHHHHFKSYHDNDDSLHSAPVAFYPDQSNTDTLFFLVPTCLGSPHCNLWVRTPDCLEIPVTALFAAPPQSRAPPSVLRSQSFCAAA